MTFSKCYSIAKFRVFSAAIIGVVFGLSGWVASADIVQDEDVALVNPVKLVPQVEENRIGVDKTSQCKRNDHPGCLHFDRGVRSLIVFYFEEPQNHAKNCSSADNKYVITKIELTATGEVEAPKKNDRDDEGNFRGPFPLPTWLKDAFPAIDLTTGIVYEAASLDVARAQVRVSNLNNHKEDLTKSFWYRVTVKACDGKNTWVLDPRGDNQGGG